MYLANGETLEVVTGSAATCDMIVDANDAPTSGAPSSSYPTYTNRADGIGAATTSLVADVANPSQIRSVNYISVINVHASTATLVTFRLKATGPIYDIFKVTLAAGEKAEYRKDVGWQYFDANGIEKKSFVFPTAAQADMEAATSSVLGVTPQNLNWHPSSVKCWLYCGLTGNILASWNITSLADTGVGVVTVTIGTDFSSVNWCSLVTIDFNSTTLAQSATADSKAAGTVVLRSVVEAGSSADPVSAWSMAGLGDQ